MNPRMELTDLLEISNLLLKGNKIRLRLVSNCMHPTLKEGDILKIEPISPEKVRPREIILYHNQGKLFCHRLLKRFQKMEITYGIAKGDASTSSLPPFPIDQVLARVVGAERGNWIRYVWLACLKPKIRGPLIYLLGVKGYSQARRLFPK